MKIKVPTSWNDISIGQYIELRPVLNAEMNDLERLIYLLAVLLKKPTQDIEKIKITDYQLIRKKMSFLWDQDLPREVQRYFTVEGKSFEVVLNARELNGGQYMSVATKLKGAENDPEHVYNNLHSIIASITIPVQKGKLGWKQMNIDPSYFQDTGELFYHHLPMSVAYPIGVFFYNLSKSLMISTKDYLNKNLTEAQKMKEEVMKDFFNDGDGSLRLITYLTEIFQNGNTLKK